MKSYKGISRFELFFATLFACFFSFLNFNQCRTRDFSAISTFKYFCYSDIPVFWESHFLEKHINPFSYNYIPDLSQTINPVEYPVIIGLVIWVLSYLTQSTGVAHVNYFDINAVFISLLFFASALYVYKIKPKYVLYMVFAPAAIMSLYINWDMWAVLPTLVSIYLFDKGKLFASAVCLSIAISAKFYPIVILMPVLIILLKSQKYLELKKYFSGLIISYILINLPIAIYNFSGWAFFFQTSFKRSVGYGSVWEMLEIFGIRFTNINLIYFLSTTLLFILVTTFYWKKAYETKLYEFVFLSVFAFTAFNKVYSPQFILWLTPLAVLAIRNRKHVIFFLIWQLFEFMYHIVIWRYFYKIGGGSVLFAVSPKYYALISALRLLTMIIFAASLTYKFSTRVDNKITSKRLIRPKKI